MKLELVLGLEIHIQLKLKSKMFCRCSADIYQSEPNTLTCPVCLGLPGALPVPNREAIKSTQLLGAALNCKLSGFSKFDRKNYFYPDLPKGYQISQYDLPLCVDGHLDLFSKRVGITRVHLEEDTGKSIHENGLTLLDFNKSGLALVEVVTEPDFRTSTEAVELSKLIQRIVRYLQISDADMEKGQLRLEANVSLRKQGSEKLPTYKVEIKNINSFRFLEKAIKYEVTRQSKLFESGLMPEQENRGWDDIKSVTLSQREKEEAHDYRYFPEPDIPPMEFSSKYLKEIKARVPELPDKKVERFVRIYGIGVDTARVLCESLELSEKFEKASKETDPKRLANLLVNKTDLRNLDVDNLLKRIKVKEDLLDESALKVIVKDVINLKENVKAIKDYKSGKEQSIMFLLGAVMKKANGKADPLLVKEILRKEINES
ncbi:hypothetical protein A2716_03210 [candidate division WWE3 bacterium RIFCSPHIGHO2_01_FULL_40_23]|uniref:Aspartyl/glutamyl-tRNA(Asn/Gln) amidotransferase subunit B n=1 Tax=candidate division WWE3 bacterium RIFCSPLOWO2_01_FULL_41_18 TaxID=1802625 RepID=A0A1F4VCB6_UNCKA|nr:MAG: hypothetical protein A2716_03210 [candidate division WWE3 bacterium RIFCSPHIGHO2_01_FULL_40_23]OGC54892.1 MAG: hypothetical protein A3A78_02820 [candidate division WWE3 bacterium RIFCSPLOWO2_01_FULL_41_18]